MRVNCREGFTCGAKSEGLERPRRPCGRFGHPLPATEPRKQRGAPLSSPGSEGTKQRHQAPSARTSTSPWGDKEALIPASALYFSAHTLLPALQPIPKEHIVSPWSRGRSSPALIGYPFPFRGSPTPPTRSLPRLVLLHLQCALAHAHWPPPRYGSARGAAMEDGLRLVSCIREGDCAVLKRDDVFKAVPVQRRRWGVFGAACRLPLGRGLRAPLPPTLKAAPVVAYLREGGSLCGCYGLQVLAVQSGIRRRTVRKITWLRFLFNFGSYLICSCVFVVKRVLIEEEERCSSLKSMSPSYFCHCGI